MSRAQLFKATRTRDPYDVHAHRGTFVTLALAAGRTETWVTDRTGHKSSQMVRNYKRVARTADELELGWLKPMHEVIPELIGPPLGRESESEPETSQRCETETAMVSCSVRERGLEPPHLAVPDPKSGASTSSATRAWWGG